MFNLDLWVLGTPARCCRPGRTRPIAWRSTCRGDRSSSLTWSRASSGSSPRPGSLRPSHRDRDHRERGHRQPEDGERDADRLRSMGLRLSLDDFGTGYSSLSYLHKLPIDTVKIDKSFIDRIGEASDDREIVRTIVELAHRLKLEVIAEGVETRAAAGSAPDARLRTGPGLLLLASGPDGRRPNDGRRQPLGPVPTALAEQGAGDDADELRLTLTREQRTKTREAQFGPSVFCSVLACLGSPLCLSLSLLVVLRRRRDRAPSGACRARRPCRCRAVLRCPDTPRPAPCRCRRRCPDPASGCRRPALLAAEVRVLDVGVDVAAGERARSGRVVRGPRPSRRVPFARPSHGGPCPATKAESGRCGRASVMRPDPPRPFESRLCVGAGSPADAGDGFCRGRAFAGGDGLLRAGLCLAAVVELVGGRRRTSAGRGRRSWLRRAFAAARPGGACDFVFADVLRRALRPAHGAVLPSGLRFAERRRAWRVARVWPCRVLSEP